MIFDGFSKLRFYSNPLESEKNQTGVCIILGVKLLQEVFYLYNQTSYKRFISCREHRVSIKNPTLIFPPPPCKLKHNYFSSSFDRAFGDLTYPC